MTIEECYHQLGGNYAEAKSRLMSDRLIDKFVRKFPADPTMQQLRDAIYQGDRQGAFAAAHTLKGVAGNLSFTLLQQAADALTEQLRDGQQEPDAMLVNDVYKAYEQTVETIEMLK